MANRSSEERNTRSLMRMKSGTYHVSLPIEMVQHLKWREKQKLNVSIGKNEIVIRDSKK